MERTRTFKLSHSVFITAVLIFIELVLTYLPLPVAASIGCILMISIIGALVNIYIATEVVEEVKGSRHMLVLLSTVMAEFILFFAFQYWFLSLAQQGSFPTLAQEPISLLLNSVMIFVFNPLYIPATVAGRSLLLINTFGALGLVLFVLQNVGAFRRKSLDAGVKGF
jgi:hypothetical protein